MGREEFRVFDLTEILPDDLLADYPLLRYCQLCGHECIFQLWAACCGCDFTREKRGLLGVGPETVLEAFEEIEDNLQLRMATTLAMWIVDPPLPLHNDYNATLSRIKDIVACYDTKARVYFLGRRTTRDGPPVVQFLSRSGVCIEESSETTQKI